MLPRALLLSTVVIWGWTFIATKVLVAELGPVEIFALRLVIGLPFLGVILAVKRVPLSFARADVRPLLLGGAIFTLHFLVQITGIAIATAGVLLLVSRGSLRDLGWLRSVGDWMVLASAHTWAFYTIATRDLVRRRDPLAVTFGILLIAAAFTAVLFAVSGDLASVRGLSPRGVVALLYLAIPGLALGQWFWQEGVAGLGAARAGLYLYLEPLATLTLAVPLLHEPFGPFVVLGGGLVLAGVYVGQREPHPDGPH